jgi:N-acylneuraminate cytidylyltransferase
MSKIVAIIPARGGSKGIKNKNIIDLSGHPLIAYSIAAAKLSLHIDEVVVTTDSAEIASIAKRYGALVPFLRPAEISQCNSLDIEFFEHYVNFLQNHLMEAPDLIVHLRPTTPLREIRVIDDAIEYMVKNKAVSALRSMHKTHLTPYKMFKEVCGYASPFLHYDGVEEFYNLPRQTFEDAYVPNGYVDIIRPSVLRETGLLHGKEMKIWQTDEVADIDVRKDLDFAKNILYEDIFKDILNWLEK